MVMEELIAIEYKDSNNGIAKAPKGYRELKDGEWIRAGDLFVPEGGSEYYDEYWLKIPDNIAYFEPYDRSFHRTHIRKVTKREKVAPGNVKSKSDVPATAEESVW